LKSIYFITAFLFWWTTSIAQDAAFHTSLIRIIKGDIQNFTLDNLGNIFLVTSSNQVKKLNDKGDSVGVYNDIRRFGKISSIDATNPLKVLVYFKDFATIIVLDRFLNTRNTIDLRQQNIFQVRAVTSSYDNNIWLFDEMDSKLKKLEDNGRVILESTDFRQVFDSVPAPSDIQDRDGQLYLYDARKGLFVFDYYGGLKNNYQFLQYSDLQVVEKNSIVARDSSNYYLYKPQTLQLQKFNLLQQQPQYSKVQMFKNRLYALKRNGDLDIFEIKETLPF
jgi:hypothetical protein